MGWGTANTYMMGDDNIAQLDPRQELYLAWICTPIGNRVPESQAKFAMAQKVSEVTLRRWKTKPAFRTEWAKRVADLQGSPERSQRLLDTLYERGLAGDNNSAKLYLQATGRLAPIEVAVAHSGRVSELSDIELAELIAASARVEQAHRADSKLKVV